jgi:hypothetical protein
MAISNFGELKSSIESWLERTDLNSRVSDFISLAERRIFRTLRCPANETKRTFTSYDGEVGLCIPDDFLELKNLTWDGCPLERISDQRYLALSCGPDIRTDNGNVQPAGRPRFFARYACKFVVWPWPPEDNTGIIQLNYWQDQSGMLVADEDTTPILTIAPGAYLYGALVEAEAFIMNDSRIPLWESRFQDTIESLQILADDSELSGGHTTARSAY